VQWPEEGPQGENKKQHPDYGMDASVLLRKHAEKKDANVADFSRVDDISGIQRDSWAFWYCRITLVTRRNRKCVTERRHALKNSSG
jgi:hypothetical protein